MKLLRMYRAGEPGLRADHARPGWRVAFSFDQQIIDLLKAWVPPADRERLGLGQGRCRSSRERGLRKGSSAQLARCSLRSLSSAREARGPGVSYSP